MNNICYITSEFQQLSWYKRWIAYYLDNIIEIFNNEKNIEQIIIVSKSHTIKNEYRVWNKILVIPIFIRNKWLIWKILFMVKLSFILPTLIKKNHIRIIETQETHTPLFLYNFFTFRKDIQHIMRLHSPEWFLASEIEKKKWFINIFYKKILIFLETIFLKKSNNLWYVISSPSKALLEELEGFYKINFIKKYIIPNFIINLKIIDNLQKDYSKKRFLYIWGLQIRKNTHGLLDTIEKVLSNNNNIEFILIWKIWEEIIREKIDHLKNTKWFIYKWEIYWDEKYKLLEYSTYYIIPSRENYSMSMIEASLYKNFLLTVDLWWNKEINIYNSLYKKWELYENIIKIIKNKNNIEDDINRQSNKIISLNAEWVTKSKKLIFELLMNEK
jgi:hypothetical protein